MRCRGSWIGRSIEVWKRRELEGLRHVGIDEKSFRSGQSYISLLTDLDKSRVLEVMEGCDQETAQALWQSLPEDQRHSIEAVALDMAPAFIAASRVAVPQADLVHDKFHIAKHLNEAVDTVRRQEHKELLAKGDETLKSTRQLWLFNPMNFSDEQAADFEQLKFSGLKVARAWAIKELFSKLWTYCYEGAPASSSRTGSGGPPAANSNQSSRWPGCSSSIWKTS